jgi:hypothetical protein
MFGIPDGAQSNGYVKRDRKPGRQAGSVTRREQASTKVAAPEDSSPAKVDLRLTESDKLRVADVIALLDGTRPTRAALRANGWCS